MTPLVLLVLPCSWTRWFIRKYFQRVIWGRWGRGIRQNFNIFLCRMDTLFFLCVFHCGFCRFLVFRNLLLLIHTRFHFIFFLLLFWLFLWYPDSFVFFPSFFLTLKIFLLLPNCISIRNKYSNPPLSLFIMRITAEACGCLFLSGWDWRASLR